MAMEEEKNDKRSRGAADIANAPADEPKQEVDEIELAKSEDEFSVAEEHKLIRKVRKFPSDLKTTRYQRLYGSPGIFLDCRIHS